MPDYDAISDEKLDVTDDDTQGIFSLNNPYSRNDE